MCGSDAALSGVPPARSLPRPEYLGRAGRTADTEDPLIPELTNVIDERCKGLLPAGRPSPQTGTMQITKESPDVSLGGVVLSDLSKSFGPDPRRARA